MPQPDPLTFAAEQACQGDPTPFYDLLRRRSCLPGPRPNLKFARTAASLLLNLQGGLCVAQRLRELSPSEAPQGSPSEFLPLVGIIALGLHACSSADQVPASLATLERFAADPRRLARDAVAIALADLFVSHPEATFDAISPFLDGYLHAHLTLLALSEPPVIQSLRDSQKLVDILDQAFSLLENAPRAHERSQGYRTLVRTLAKASPIFAKRFPDAVLPWMEAHAKTKDPELREALGLAISSLRKLGVRSDQIESAQNVWEESAPEPRDPRSYVGPTRGRGNKSRRRAK